LYNIKSSKKLLIRSIAGHPLTNMDKLRYPIALFLASFVMLMIGLIFKIMHWPGGQLITGSMFMVQAVSIVWIIIVLLKPTKKP
jgi:hypothetical protein